MARYRLRLLLYGLLISAVSLPSVVARGQDAGPPLISQADEVRFAAKVHPEIVRRYGGEYRDSEIAEYVRQVGMRLVHAHGDQGYRFHFTVLDSPDVFAFAQGGGYIYISRAMLSLASKEDELAAVLAHEIAHVFARHGALREALKTELNPADVSSKDFINAFTREHELEADAMSIPILIAAGYDPFSQGQFLDAVREYDRVNISYGIARESEMDNATHPGLRERADLATLLAASMLSTAVTPSEPELEGFPGTAYLASKSTRLLSDSKLYEVVDGMVFGRRPSEGMATGNTYVNTDWRIQFELPPGFHFTYAGRTILAEGPSGGRMRFDSYTSRRIFNKDLVEYLQHHTGYRIDPATAEALEINGLPGAFAEAKIRTPEGLARTLVAVVQSTARTLFRFSFVMPPETSDHMMERIKSGPLSFRRLTREEAGEWEPLRIEIVTVDSDMTVESLAARMRMLHEPLEWFWMLNQFEPGLDLVPGQRIKLITD